MLWAKRIDYILLVLYIAIFVATRLPGLGTDTINPDAVNWHYRSEQFVVGLKTLALEKTYQHYHPGVTLMWIVGPTVELIKQLSPTDRVYNQHNFIVFHTFSKYSLVFVQLMLSFVVIYLLSLIFDNKLAIFATALFTLEPFFLGNARLLHLDVLLSLTLFAGLLASFVAAKMNNFWLMLLAGILLGLAFLTKSIAVGGLGFVLIFGTFLSWLESGRVSAMKYVFAVLLSFAATTIILFPAMWVKPAEVLVNIFDEAERVGIRKGHGQIVLGEYSRDPGVLFYLLVLLLKTSPVAILGVGIYLFAMVRKASAAVKNITELAKNPLFYLSVFYVGYLVVMTYPAKKLDRYTIPEFPYLALIAVCGYFEVKKRWSLVGALLPVLLTLGFIAYPVVALYPYYFTYTNPLFGSAKAANALVAQKPFGIAVPQLKEFVLANYGYYPKLGFVDTKPMKAIYPNSRVFDIRVYGGGSYDLVILGPNEELPEELANGDHAFVFDRALHINGLEYWRIYVKQK